MHAYFSERHSRSMKMLPRNRPRPSIEIRMPAACKRPVKAKPVNWLPWLVLKISGVPCRARASSRASTQKLASSVPVNPSSFGRRTGFDRRYPGGAEYLSIFFTVRRSIPNLRPAS